MTDDLELRKYALEKVLGLGLMDPAVMTDLARKFYDFLAPAATRSPVWGDTTEVIKVEAASAEENPVRPFFVRPLTPVEKVILKHIIDLHRTQEKVTGADVSRAANYAHLVQSNATIKRLVMSGYCRRDGYNIIPLRDVTGNPLPVTVQKLPEGYAMGYKPMTAPMGQVGRIS